MKLDRVTLTGADESVNPLSLATLYKEFRFVEFGILVGSHIRPRFPGWKWIAELAGVAGMYALPLSLHLCGAPLRSVLGGKWPWDDTLDWFQRIQLNFHSYFHIVDMPKMVACLKPFGRQIIFQCDGVNDHLVGQARDAGLDAVALYDRSGGAGVLPAHWSMPMVPIVGIYCGYAGGLEPDNLEVELHRIAAVVGDSRIWIDAESKLRSEDDRQFDLEKVQRFLELAAPFVNHQVKQSSP